MSLDRRHFLVGAAAGAGWLVGCRSPQTGTSMMSGPGVRLAPASEGEDVFGYLDRVHGGFDLTAYRRILGAANEFKEGDEAQEVAAADEDSRAVARALISRTSVDDLMTQSVFVDEVSEYIDAALDPAIRAAIGDWTLGELVAFLEEHPEAEIRAILPGLPSDVIGCCVKLMSNDDLIAVSRKIFHPLPGTQIGSAGYLSARVQPNSPTDDPEDIFWQVLDGWSYAVGDALLGTNPVSSEVDSVASIESTLADVIATFELQDALPHCVLSHIDVQAEVERRWPGSTALWFQSLAGVESANETFGISVESMRRHAQSRTGPYGLYFETGQGADATNGHGQGFDMVLHEARKYGFARALQQEVATAAGRDDGRAWVHVNDVAGFIGPEVFQSREQLVRCCLEDIVMGKLHGLTIGLDVCSTLHMDVDLDDLDWCLEQVAPANPAYLMALPTKNDPMLSYLTTAFQDHVRLREKFGFKVNDRMWQFFQELGVIDADGRPTEHFGEPTWVYLQYRRRKGDQRPDREILFEGAAAMERVRGHGVFLAESFGDRPSDPEPDLDRKVRDLYADSKRCIWEELPADFSVRLCRSSRALDPVGRSPRLHPSPADRRASVAVVAGVAGGSARFAH